MKFWAALICSILLISSASARPQQSGVYTPKAGSGERKAILDSLRKPVTKEMNQPVVFYNVALKVKSGWAFVHAIGKDTNGKPLKKFGDQYFPFDALLRKKGTTWEVLSWGSGGGTDALDAAMTKFPQAPRAIFLPYTGPASAPL